MTGFPKELLMFKSQLQEYAQKAGLTAPVYGITREGPSHEPHFKATVTLDDVTYESPSVYRNLKKAEHAAAEVALQALAKNANISTVLPGPLHESGLCKNLLQEHAQKCKLSLPVYRLERSGEIHSPSFSSSVEIAGVHYKGGVAKSKKEAEIKAAKTALIAILSDTNKCGSPLQVSENQQTPVNQQGNLTDTAIATLVNSYSRTKGKKRRRNHRFRDKGARKAKIDGQPAVKLEKVAAHDSSDGASIPKEHAGNPVQFQSPSAVQGSPLEQIGGPCLIPKEEHAANPVQFQSPTAVQVSPLEQIGGPSLIPKEEHAGNPVQFQSPNAVHVSPLEQIGGPSLIHVITSVEAPGISSSSNCNAQESQFLHANQFQSQS